MTKTIKLALVAAMAMGATSAFATNGDNLIGLGAKSRAMGGTGVAHYNGAESATSNPALITKGKGVQFTFGGTYFRPDVEVKTSNTLVGSPVPGDNDLSAESDAKHNVIPFVALTHDLENGFVVGASMFGSAGMGTDWRSTAPLGNADFSPAAVPAPGSEGDFGLYSMRSNLLLLKFSVPIAYGQDNWSVGIAPVLMYGSLDISFQTPDQGFPFGGGPGTGPVAPIGGVNNQGHGSSSSFGIGLELGAAYTLPDMGLTIGATYHSPIEMEYKDQISSAGAAFGFGGATAGFSDKLEQPGEYGLGIDWTEGDISLTADWKNIRWGSARGYEDFGWENQSVYALGGEYRMDDLTLRAGFNYASNPIKNNQDSTSVTGQPLALGGNSIGDTKNAFNAVMFPAITQRHYTLGAGYQFTKNVGVDAAFTYGVSGDQSYDAASVGLGKIEVSNDQIALSAGLNYTF